MTDQNYRNIIARGWIQKAEDSFAEANILFDGKRMVGCINRLYYSAFYAVSAALAEEGKEYGKHTAVRSSLHRDFVKIGKVPLSVGKTFDELFDDRQEGDYKPSTSFKEEDISRLLSETRDLIDRFKKLIT
jgi:uncharacterized protein (UPF0332 family)